jgi:uncharacterized repeat protein (TIGR02543 family)
MAGRQSETVKISSETAAGATATAKENYKFIGWYTDAECKHKVGATEGAVTEGKFEPAKFGTYTEGTRAYYALFEEVDVTIKYQAETGGSVTTVSETMKIFAGNPAGSTAKADEGYTFAGWYRDGEQVGTDAFYNPQKVDGKNVSATYIAKFTENTVDISYVLVGPAAGAQLTNAKDENVKVINGKPEGSAVSLNPGYSFKGWYTDPECNNLVNADDGKDEDTKFTPAKGGSGFYEAETFYAKVKEDEARVLYEVVELSF